LLHTLTHAHILNEALGWADGVNIDRIGLIGIEKASEFLCGCQRVDNKWTWGCPLCLSNTHTHNI